MMESNTFTLSKPLRNRIQGLAGELVALDYVRENLKIDFGDKVIITTNRCNKLQTEQSATKNPMGAYFYTVYKSPFDFLRHALVDNFHKIGCEGIDFTNADILAKTLFDKYMSKTKKQILSELERLGRLYRKEREKLERRIKAQREESERRIKERENVDNDNEWYKTMISEIVNTLSHEDLAKVLTLIELEKRYFEKKPLSISEFKIGSLNTFKNYFLRNVEWAERDYENRRNTIKIISEYANAKFEIWKIFSSVFNCLNLTKNKPDAMIMHYHEEKLKKLILIECKSGDAVLSPNQNDCIDCIKKIKTDKVGYERINVDYQLPEKLTISEISYIP